MMDDGYRSLGGYGWCEVKNKITTFSFRSFSAAPLLCDSCNSETSDRHKVYTEKQILTYLVLSKSVVDIAKNIILEKIVGFVD
jgi:hypothetical protein